MKAKTILPIAMFFLVSMMTLTLGARLGLDDYPYSVNVPTQGTNNSGAITFNVSVNDTGAVCINTTAIEIWYDSGGAAVDTWLANMTNTSNCVFGGNETLNCTEFTKSVATSSLTDGNYYNFSATAFNLTGVCTGNATSVRNVTVDNTVPSITVSTDLDTIAYRRIFKYTTTISDATSGLNQSQLCSIVSPLSSTSTNISTSASSVLFDDASEAGDYNISCSATDYAGNANVASTIVTVDEAGKVSGGATATGGAGTFSSVPEIIDNIKEKLSGTNMLVIAVIVVVLIALASKKK